MKLGVAGTAVLFALGVSLATASSGCAMTFEEARLSAPKVASPNGPAKDAPRDNKRCQDIADRESFWNAVATASAVAAGAGGLATIPVPDRYQGLPVGFGVTAAITAAGAKVYAHSLGTTWARECAS